MKFWQIAVSDEHVQVRWLAAPFGSFESTMVSGGLGLDIIMHSPLPRTPKQKTRSWPVLVAVQEDQKKERLPSAAKWRLGTLDGSKSTLVKGRLSESSHVIMCARIFIFSLLFGENIYSLFRNSTVLIRALPIGILYKVCNVNRSQLY
jgi:hypothetical protein